MHNISKIVDGISVVSESAGHRVRPGTSVDGVVSTKPRKRVGGSIAEENIVRAVAGSADCGSGERQVLDIAAIGAPPVGIDQAEIVARIDLVDAGAGTR